MAKGRKIKSGDFTYYVDYDQQRKPPSDFEKQQQFMTGQMEKSKTKEALIQKLTSGGEENDIGAQGLGMLDLATSLPFIRQGVTPALQEIASPDNVHPAVKALAATFHGLMGLGMSPYSEATGAVSEALKNVNYIDPLTKQKVNLGQEITGGLNKTMQLPFEAARAGSQGIKKIFDVVGVKLPTVINEETDKKLNDLAIEGGTLLLTGMTHSAVRNYINKKLPEIKGISYEDQNQETSRIPTEQRESTIRGTEEQTQRGTPQRASEGVQPEETPQANARIVSTAVETPEGIVTGDRPFDAHDTISETKGVVAPEKNRGFIVEEKNPYYDKNGDLTDYGFEHVQKNLKNIIDKITKKYNVSSKPFYDMFTISKNGNYYNSFDSILNVGNNVREFKQLVKAVKELYIEKYPDKIDELNNKINSMAQQFLDAEEKGLKHENYKEFYAVQKITDEILNEFNDSIPKEGITQRFINREEAAKAAYDAGQIKEPVEKLHSEDLRKAQPTSLTTGETKPPEVIASEEVIPTKETGKVQPETTGLKNVITDLERETRGIEPIPKPETKEIEPTYDKVKAQVDSGEINPINIVNEINKKPRTLSDNETLAVTYYKGKLQNAYDSISKKMFEEQDRGGDTTQQKVRLAQIEDELNTIDQAGKKAGTEWGRAGRFRQVEIKDDYSLSAIKQKARVANDGKPIDKITDNRLNEFYRRLDEANSKLKAQDERIARLEAEKSVQRLAREEKINARRTKRVQTKEELVKERETLYNQLYKVTSKLSANPFLDPEAYKIVGNLARNYVREGIVTLDGIVDNIYNELKDVFENLDKRDIRDAISGYGRPIKQLTKEESTRQYEEIKRQGKLVSKLEDVKSGEYVETPKKVRPQLDPETIKLKATTERLKSLIDGEIRKIQRENRPKLEKTLDWGKSWYRNILLSGTNTIGKLTSYAIQKSLVLKPIDALETSIFSKTPGLSKIAERASIEGGGGNLNALAKNYTEFVRGWLDWEDHKSLIKTGHGQLDELYGRSGMYNTPEASAFFGHLHGVLKQPTKRASFLYALEKQSNWYLKNGYDLSDPTVQATINTAAYEYAMRDILLNDNAIVNAYKAATGTLAKQGTSGKIGATAAQIMLPIVKVPTNYVLDTAGYLGGGVKAGAMIFKAIRGGLENLKLEDANTIMRLAKKQTIGLGLLAIGYYNADSFGGYYQPGQKRKPSELKPGQMKVFGWELPAWASHNPAIEAMQFGATLRKLIDSRNGKAGDDIGTAVLKTTKELTQEIPFFNDQLIPSTDATKMIADKVRSVIPPDIQKLARAEDMSRQSEHAGLDYFLTGRGEIQKRYSKGFIEEIEMGIPGLRKKISTKPKRAKAKLP